MGLGFNAGFVQGLWFRGFRGLGVGVLGFSISGSGLGFRGLGCKGWSSGFGV